MLSDLVIFKPFSASGINHIIQLMFTSAIAMLRNLCAALCQVVGESTTSFIKMQTRALLEPRGCCSSVKARRLGKSPVWQVVSSLPYWVLRTHYPTLPLDVSLNGHSPSTMVGQQRDCDITKTFAFSSPESHWFGHHFSEILVLPVRPASGAMTLKEQSHNAAFNCYGHHPCQVTFLLRSCLT